MKRSSVRFVFAAVLVACVALPILAGDRSGVLVVARPDAAGPGDDPGLGRFILCLRILDLTPVQKADILGLLDASKPILQADADAIKADAQKLRSDIESGADKCVIGQDTLDLRAARKNLHADVESVKDQILSKLTEDQKKKLRGCVEAPPTAAAASTGDGSE